MAHVTKAKYEPNYKDERLERIPIVQLMKGEMGVGQAMDFCPDYSDDRSVIPTQVLKILMRQLGKGNISEIAEQFISKLKDLVYGQGINTQEDYLNILREELELHETLKLIEDTLA